MQSQAQSRTRFGRLVALTGCLALAGALAACAAKVDRKAPDPDVTAKELGTEEAKPHFRGPVLRVIDTVRTNGRLNADQSLRVGTIARELEENQQNHKELHERLRNSAVTVVRSGTANSEEFQESVSEAVGAIEERVQQNVDALEEIHGILEPEQRSAVAAAMRVKIAERFGRAPAEKRHRHGFDRFASHLLLSKLQIDQLSTLKKELIGEKQRLRPTREELLELVDAFESDDFSTPLNAFRDKKIALLRVRVADAGKRADSVLAIFTPEQRELLADLILEGPAKVLLGDQNANARQSGD